MYALFSGSVLGADWVGRDSLDDLNNDAPAGSVQYTNGYIIRAHYNNTLSVGKAEADKLYIPVGSSEIELSVDLDIEVND